MLEKPIGDRSMALEKLSTEIKVKRDLQEQALREAKNKQRLSEARPANKRRQP